jgi:hypothetical protein
MDTPVGTVKSRLRRARDELQEYAQMTNREAARGLLLDIVWGRGAGFENARIERHLQT